MASPIGFAPNTVVTWQFPVLVKYKFPLGRLSPFLEGGPSFRSAGNLNRSDPSHVGVSAGVGVEAQWRRLRIAPRVRYTRWAALLHDSTAARVGALFQLLVQDTTGQDFGLPSSAIRLRM